MTSAYGLGTVGQIEFGLVRIQQTFSLGAVPEIFFSFCIAADHDVEVMLVGQGEFIVGIKVECIGRSLFTLLL